MPHKAGQEKAGWPAVVLFRHKGVRPGGRAQTSMIVVDAWPWQDRASCEADGYAIYQKSLAGYLCIAAPDGGTNHDH